MTSRLVKPFNPEIHAKLPMEDSIRAVAYLPNVESKDGKPAPSPRTVAFCLIVFWTVAAASLGAVAAAQVVHVDQASGRPGDTVELKVRFAGQGSGASALKVDLGFDASTPILAENSGPACTVNPDISKESTTFRFLPGACAVGFGCVQVRAAVISFHPERNPQPIPDGTVFSCRFMIPASANVGDVFEMRVDSVSAVFPDGREIDATASSVGNFITAVETVPCPCDLSDDGEVSLGEVQKAFNSYLRGCLP